MIVGRFFDSGPASRIAPRLWQGGLPANLSELKTFGFDAIVLAAKELQPYNCADCFPNGLEDFPPDVEVINAPLDDEKNGPTLEEVHTAVQAAKRALQILRNGGRVLTSCAAGRNRSGLLSALLLHKMYGLSGRAAAAHVREARPNALTNPGFSAFLDLIPGTLTSSTATE